MGFSVTGGKKGENACKKGVSRLFFFLPYQVDEHQGTCLPFISSVLAGPKKNARPCSEFVMKQPPGRLSLRYY